MTELNITKFPHLSTLEKDKQVEYVTPVEGQVTGKDCCILKYQVTQRSLSIHINV